MYVGRRSGAPALWRARALAWGALALSFAFGSCSGERSDASDTELLERNREREDLQLLGGQTGDGTGVADRDEGRESLREPCLEANVSRPLLQAEVPAEVGFSADDVLGWVQGGIDSSLGWAPDGPLTASPERGSGRVELRFAYQGAGIRLHSPTRIVMIDGQPACKPWVEVDVSASLRTPGGAFDEHFAATLRATRPGVVGFSGAIETADLAGALELQTTRVGATLQRFEVVGTLTEHGSFGQVHALYLQSITLEADSVAAWPAPTECPPAVAGTGVPIGDDATFIDRSVADWKRAFSDLDVLPLTWSDGARTRLALDIQPNSAACYTTSWVLANESLRYGVQILALSEDGRWNGGYLGTARISLLALPRQVSARLVSTAIVPPDQADDLGVALPADTELESFSSLTFDLQMGQFVLDDPPVGGALTVTGLRDLACSEGSPSERDACVSARSATLTSARLGSSAGD